MPCLSTRTCVAASVSLVWAAHASDIISDLASVVGPSPTEENRALETRAEDFWQIVLKVAEEMKMVEHLSVFDEAEQVLAQMPEENVYVRDAITEAVKNLRRADDQVLAQGVRASTLASQKSAAPAGGSMFGGLFSSAASFVSGGSQQGFLSSALRRFVAGGDFPERLAEDVAQRQADLLPVLEGVAGASGSVLKDTRSASTRAFDVLKYDIYQKGVPKTPKAAKDVANKLVDAAAETRSRFTSFLTGVAVDLTRDVESKRQDAFKLVAPAGLRRAVELPSATTMGAREQVLNL